MELSSLEPLITAVFVAVLDYLIARSKSSSNSVIQLIIRAIQKAFTK